MSALESACKVLLSWWTVAYAVSLLPFMMVGNMATNSAGEWVDPAMTVIMVMLPVFAVGVLHIAVQLNAALTEDDGGNDE